MKELRHPLRNVTEVITTTTDVEAVMTVACMLNNTIQAPSSYKWVWDNPEPLTREQLTRKAKSYFRDMNRTPVQAVRLYHKEVAIQRIAELKAAGYSEQATPLNETFQAN